MQTPRPDFEDHKILCAQDQIQAVIDAIVARQRQAGLLVQSVRSLWKNGFAYIFIHHWGYSEPLAVEAPSQEVAAGPVEIPLTSLMLDPIEVDPFIARDFQRAKTPSLFESPFAA